MTNNFCGETAKGLFECSPGASNAWDRQDSHVFIQTALYMFSVVSIT